MGGTEEAGNGPVIVVSAGRSGSTIFFDVLAHHPRAAWLSRACDWFPDRPALNRLVLRARDLPWIGSVVHRLAYPRELFGFWRHHARGFNMPCRDLRAGDLTADQRRHLRKVLSDLRTPRRRRLLLKVTGWPRVGYLAALFPEARFIHILRDGRAVANSFLQQPWWGGWGGPWNWRYGELDAESRRLWERHDRSFVALAGIQWNLLMDAFDEARKAVPADRFLDIRYEDLCSRPMETFRNCLEFGALEEDPRFEERVRANRWSSANERWREDLTSSQQATLEAVVRERLERHGYA